LFSYFQGVQSFYILFLEQSLGTVYLGFFSSRIITARKEDAEQVLSDWKEEELKGKMPYFKCTLCSEYKYF
jgi:hypothetical protein